MGMILVIIPAWWLITHNPPVDFNTQVKPILNKKCIVCHGGVKRRADFSLLFRVDALAKAKSGKPAIIPGDPDHSEMIRRLTLSDPEDRMPYKQPPLVKEEIQILKDWIRQGARWGDHWAYVPVQPVPVPKPESHFWSLRPAPVVSWAKNNIDYFIYDKLRQVKLQPSPEADKAMLLRRVSLDLTGLPPSPKIAAAYLQDTSSTAYEKLVDSLLASPHYGERWAAIWLDLARYADTKGYERDDSRNIWRYRDWLIRSFNEDKPYDQFLTEQLAGDLLPDPTDAQMIATAFHRNTMTNDEGGTDNEEFRTAAVIDRVNTTWQALMGTTFACVQCHSHPYDPFRHDEYYQFMAFFNDTRDEDTYADYPLLRQFSGADSADLERLTGWVGEKGSPQRAQEVRRFLRTWQPSINSIRADQFVNGELADTKWLIFRNHASARLAHVCLEGRDQLIYRYQGYAKGGTWTIHMDQPGGPVLKRITVATTKGWTIDVIDIPVHSGTHDLYLTYENPLLTKPDASGMEFDWFCFTQSLPGSGSPEYATMRNTYERLIRAQAPTIPVMMDNPADMHRPTYVFEKGNWLMKGPLVTPETPRSLNPFPANAPRNRLGLAMWLTSKQNPLTARTLVNRLWEQVFGAGIVETLEDLGTQGAEPTHRELLDYLSWQLMNEDGWSIRKLLKEIVLSATYRQDSKVTKAQLDKDPYNKYYARGARVRLAAEAVRDQALAVSGLLSDKMFGPGVMPWQPKGIWLSPWNGQDWRRSEGEDQYRRALYTYWKRTAPYPSMISFDGSAREVCIARRIRTNTPLQALVLLNDSVYLEASRHLAYRMMRDPGAGKEQGKSWNDQPAKAQVREAISRGYAMILFRPLAPDRLSILEHLYDAAYAQFLADKARASAMTGVREQGQGSQKGGQGDPATASMIVVANAILNLDEVVTKN